MGVAIAQIYQLKVTLVDSQPPIWRRFWVPDCCTLSELHQTLQLVMGWQNAHLHEFEIGGDRFGIPDPDGFDNDIGDQSTVTLKDLALAASATFRYTYDFGDGWLHQVLVEKVLSPSEAQGPYPQCLKGKRACPPEDCGGIWGYEDILSRWDDAGDPDIEELIDWLGGDFDPEAFDLAAINQRLKPLQNLA